MLNRCASHILDIFCVFSSRCDLEVNEVRSKECRFHRNNRKEITFFFFSFFLSFFLSFFFLGSSIVILILLREREGHSQILLYLWFHLNHVAPTYKVGALLHEPDSTVWGYLLCTFFMKIIFGFGVYWWVVLHSLWRGLNMNFTAIPAFMLRYILVSCVLIRVVRNSPEHLTRLNISILMYFYTNCLIECPLSMLV